MAGQLAGTPPLFGEVLRNELYIGVVIWNRTRWIKSPEGRRRRPESEWRRVEQ